MIYQPATDQVLVRYLDVNIVLEQIIVMIRENALQSESVTYPFLPPVLLRQRLELFWNQFQFVNM